jgi:hypothetical protein
MADTSWIKPGAKAVVEVIGAPDSNGLCLVFRPNGKHDIVWADTISPLPAAEPITALEREVVEAAEKWAALYQSYNYDGTSGSAQLVALFKASQALDAARHPPDPLKEAVRGLRALYSSSPVYIPDMAEAIARVEAAMKEAGT